MVVVAQLVRAPGCGPGGRRFESDLPPHFFALISRQKNNEDVRLRPYGLRRDKQVFTQKSSAFSSLPRRNEMKTGHLHQTPEALLACPAIALATADEVFSLREEGWCFFLQRT